MESPEYLQKLEDPRSLTSREEIIEQCKNGLHHALYNYKRSEGKLEYELVTQELVEGLANHLASYAHQEKVVILEVCAGNGKLAYHMQRLLQEKYGDIFQYHAVDNGDDTRVKRLPLVENIDNTQGIEKYNPDIIICSRLPHHPYEILPKGFMERFDVLQNKSKHDITEQEEKELQKLSIQYSDLHSGNDTTFYRRQKRNLKEYILIGKPSVTGNDVKTHGYKDDVYIPKYFYDHYSREELDDMFGDKNALFKKDGFVKTRLHIPTLNRMNVLFGFKDKADHSQVYSFKRMQNEKNNVF